MTVYRRLPVLLASSAVGRGCQVGSSEPQPTAIEESPAGQCVEEVFVSEIDHSQPTGGRRFRNGGYVCDTVRMLDSGEIDPRNPPFQLLELTRRAFSKLRE